MVFGGQVGEEGRQVVPGVPPGLGGGGKHLENFLFRSEKIMNCLEKRERERERERPCTFLE